MDHVMYRRAANADAPLELFHRQAERRINHRQRAAILRLRLAEMRAADHLPTDDLHELTAAIDAIVDALRQANDQPDQPVAP